MPVPARLEPRQRLGNLRHAARRTLKLGSALSHSGAAVTIHDLSVTGLLIETSGELSEGEILLADLPTIGPTPSTVVWNRGRFFGCKFEVAIPPSAVSAALLKSPVLEKDDPSEPLRLVAIDEPAEAASDEVLAGGHLSLRTRMLVILGLAAVSWAVLILAANGLL